MADPWNHFVKFAVSIVSLGLTWKLYRDFASWMKQLEAASKKEAANSKKQQPVDCGKSYQINNDRLAWYTESRFYDCSFSVGRENPKIFKCHRIVLALESEVFEKMLFGSFAEGRKMKDDAIVFDDSTLPETFDQVMRFIYGYEIRFSTVPMACDVYRFAHKWLVKSLEEAAVEVLRKTVKADQILMVYEMHRFFGDVKEEEFYRQKIKNEIGKVLSSASWIQATPSTVLDIFKEKVLTVSEKELFDALVRWGRANETSAAHLRAKIDSALKEIRFMSMDAEDFAKLSSDNAEIFSVEERLMIFTSIELRDPNRMPPDFTVCGENRKNKTYKKYCIHNTSKDKVYYTNINCDSTQSCTIFSVQQDSPVYMSQVDLDCMLLKDNYGQEVDLICKLTRQNSGKQLAIEKFKGNIGPETTGVTFLMPVLLENNTQYAVSIQYFNKNPLRSKKYVYEANPSGTLFSRVNKKDKTYHTDMNSLKLFSC